MADADSSNHLSIAYDQLSTSYRAIDDFRAKLLGFLPLVTGGGLILLTGRAGEVRKEFFGPVGLFGIAVTSGLLAYEIFAIKKCHALIVAGAALEKELHLSNAQFTSRPNSVLHVINEPFAAAAIYSAVLAAWTYLALYFDQSHRGKIISPIVFVVGFVVILLFDLSLRKPSFLRRFLPWLRSQSPYDTPDTRSLEGAPQTTAPDGSVVRPLCQITGLGSFAHFQLEPGGTAKAVSHATVQEIWYIIGGTGQMWRRHNRQDPTCIELRPGICLTIPLSTTFQFRAEDGDDPLRIVAVTMPPWPVDNEHEARLEQGPWTPSF